MAIDQFSNEETRKDPEALDIIAKQLREAIETLKGSNAVRAFIVGVVESHGLRQVVLPSERSMHEEEILNTFDQHPDVKLYRKLYLLEEKVRMESLTSKS